ncbi:AIPR family protein [Nitrosococcus wardiae]|uniref:AIPR family protein n=1 Tax=Nitrosococcus wardiae TaxID=1814290 RepID=UPI0019820713|nr:AIPR family protein [Nitrosococcus wardiae]
MALSVASDPIDVEMGLSQWGRMEQPHMAYYGMLAGEEVAQWWMKYGRRLFERNIRQVLGPTDVNEEIRQTLATNPSNFWYFNNGITIVANRVQKSMVGGSSRGQGIFSLQGAQIVNGAQTVSSIGRYYESGGDGLDEVWLSARVISLEEAPAGFGLQVTRNNNRQNRIASRDFVSQDQEQIRIKTELAIDGIEYNIVRSETFKSSAKSFDLQEATVALACGTGDAVYAVQAKREIGKFYEDLSGNLYRRLFNTGVVGVYVYNMVRIVRIVDEFLENEIRKLQKKSGRWYGLLVHGNRMVAMLVILKLGLETKAKDSEFKPDQDQIKESAGDVTGIVFHYLENNYPDSMLGTLFKNAGKCKNLVRNCA